MRYIPSQKERALYPIASGVMTMPDGRELCITALAYKRRTRDLANRQQLRCALCHHLSNDLTFDHEAGRGMNGAHRNDALVDAEDNWINAALCMVCQGIKGSRRYHWKDGAYVPKAVAARKPVRYLLLHHAS